MSRGGLFGCRLWRIASQHRTAGGMAIFEVALVGVCEKFLGLLDNLRRARRARAARPFRFLELLRSNESTVTEMPHSFIATICKGSAYRIT
jgi:hypothetical protein